MRPEDRPQIASNPDLSDILERAGVNSAVHDLIEHAAGDYARTIQFEERASGMQRDIAQADITNENCAKLDEVVSLVDANNAGSEN